MDLFGEKRLSSPSRGSMIRDLARTSLTITLMVGGLSLATLIEATGATAAELLSPSATLRKLAPAALSGDREALRDVASAIVKIGPREFNGAKQMRNLLRTEALRKSSAAANAYAMMLQYGIGGAARPGEAALWYARGSAQGNISASKNAAEAYALGWGVSRDTRRALRMLAEVPIDQRARKMLHISKALLEPGYEQPEVALLWLKRAVSLYSRGQTSAEQISRRIATLDAESGEDMRIWLEPLAAKGNGAAAMMLASYIEASGKTENQAETLKLYLLAAEKGIEGAYKALGSLMSSGSQDTVASALNVLEKKARTGATLAKLVLAEYFLFQSASSSEFRSKGLMYLQQAARDGDPQAQYKLAITLLSSPENSEQRTLAKAYLVLSAKRGNRMAEIAIAQVGNLPLQTAKQIVAIKTQ